MKTIPIVSLISLLLALSTASGGVVENLQGRYVNVQLRDLALDIRGDTICVNSGPMVTPARLTVTGITGNVVTVELTPQNAPNQTFMGGPVHSDIIGSQKQTATIQVSGDAIIINCSSIFRGTWTRVGSPAAAPQNQPDFPIARWSGTPGGVISPYPPHNLIRVDNIPEGALVLDQTTGKVFRRP
jgi:hypothetical protein